MTEVERKQQTEIENYIPNLFDEEGNIIVDPLVEPAVLLAGEPPAGAPAEVRAEAPKKKKEKAGGGGGGGASESKGDEGPILISKNQH